MTYLWTVNNAFKSSLNVTQPLAAVTSQLKGLVWIDSDGLLHGRQRYGPWREIGILYHIPVASVPAITVDPNNSTFFLVLCENDNKRTLKAVAVHVRDEADWTYSRILPDITEGLANDEPATSFASDMLHATYVLREENNPIVFYANFSTKHFFE